MTFGRFAHRYCDFEMDSSAILVTGERAGNSVRDLFLLQVVYKNAFYLGENYKYAYNKRF